MGDEFELVRYSPKVNAWSCVVIGQAPVASGFFRNENGIGHRVLAPGVGEATTAVSWNAAASARCHTASAANLASTGRVPSRISTWLAAPLRLRVLLVLLGVLGVACSSSADSRADGQRQLVAEVASFDLSPERTERFVVGLFASDRGEVAFGEIELSFDYLGPMSGPNDDSQEETPVGVSAPVTAEFLSIPGTEQLSGDEPTFDPPGGVRGVYGTTPIRFPAAGVWEVTVAATVDGDALTTSTAFEVFTDSVVPGPGDPAPRSEQPLPGDPSVSPQSIDSRLGFGEELPDPTLHRVTIADALDVGRPVMVTITTPVFCVSRFCGPITDELVRLETEYGDSVEFVHLEVWEDFENGVLNDAAAEWVAPQGMERAAEPWVFLVDSTGTIATRWDNVASREELTAALDQIAG